MWRTRRKKRGQDNMRMLIATLAATAALGLTAAHADTVAIDDPLHLCYAAPGNCTGFNGVTISTNPATGLSGWGFSSSPKSQSGTLDIILMVPNNEQEIVLPTLTGTLNGNPLTIGQWVTLPGLFSSGKLTDFLNINASPPNPLSAYIGATQALDASATGYTVLSALVTGFTTGPQAGQTNVLDNVFSLIGGDYIQGVNEFTGVGPGSIITGFLSGSHGIISTAQSSSLILDAPGGNVPEPSTWAMMLVGFAGLSYAAFRRNGNSRLEGVTA